MQPQGVTLTPNASAPGERTFSATDGAEDVVTERMNQLQLAPYRGIMDLAVETRLEIYRHFITPNRYRFCPHVRLPLLISSARIGLPYLNQGEPFSCLHEPTTCGSNDSQFGGKFAHQDCLQKYLRSSICFDAANNLDFSLLRVCQRFNAEVLDLFYSENVFYFEQHLTLVFNKSIKWSFAWLKPPQHLLDIPPQRRHMVKKIGFSVTDESIIDHRLMVWQHLCYWIIKNLPNLRHTYIFLFSNPVPLPGQVGFKEKKPSTRPSDRFLVKMIDLLDTLPGQKTIEFRGSNKSKRIVGNILAPYFEKGRKKKDQSISGEEAGAELDGPGYSLAMDQVLEF
ncbi:MAG: hypothetical protein Q9169_005788 [Polycauliona sp. 2 TL-2023]